MPNKLVCLLKNTKQFDLINETGPGNRCEPNKRRDEKKEEEEKKIKRKYFLRNHSQRT